MIKHLFFLSLIVIISACNTSSLLVNVMRPADITVPKHIQEVVVANRSVPSKSNLGSNIIEGVLTGELVGADKKASEYCIQGLSSMLSKSTRYNLRNPSGMELKGTGTSSFPIPLKWKKVNNICTSYNNADALLVLETFDSDSHIIEGKPVVRIKKIKGKKIKELRYPVTLIMEIESGWRIYDIKNKNIIDESKFTEVKEFKVWGLNPKIARSLLPSRMNALRDAGIKAGEKFGLRISPVWVNVRRAYYTGKQEGFKRAKSFVKKRDWDTAIEIWKDLSNHSDIKVSAKACFNMALASEIKGAIDSAIQWAKKAEKLGNKKAKNYISTLYKRKLDEEKLKQQLTN